MATEEEKNALDVSSAELQPDGDPFAGVAAGGDAEADVWALDTHEQLSEHEVFVGDEDFYKLLAESTGESTVREPAPGRRLLQASIRYKHLSSVQKVLIAAIALVASMLLYAQLRPAGQTDAGSPLTSTDKISPTVGQSLSVEGVPPSNRGQDARDTMQPALSPTQPLSLEVARSFFVQREYDKARVAYEQLRQALPASDLSLRDFLQLEAALCAKEAGDLEQASRSLMAVSQSPSPAVRIVANYHLSLLEIERKRFLMARTRAYNAIALIKAADFDDDWALSFECDCHFLVAECLSRQVLMLGNTDMDLPSDLWGIAAAADPFAELREAELRTVLNSGSEHLGTGLLDPKIQRLEYQGDLPRWSVTSYGAPVEELMAKFAASADLDVHWAFNGTPGRHTGTDALQQRPVSMHLPAATSHQVVLTAAGCAGLLASVQDNPGGKLKVTISDPIEYASLDEHLSLLSQQAISLWQEFVLTFYSDKRVANAHFVMGLLQSQVDLPTEAIAEFKLVANRFSQMSLAPYALLHSSKLKTNLRDYHGVREDLRQLIEQYPDTEIYGQAYLRLADATLEAGLKTEAAQLYQRVYNFGLSAESKTASALGAARCCYETEAYSDAAKWLTQYIHLAGSSGSSNLYSAYYLLGQAYLAMEKYEQACSAFQYALAAQSSREQYVEAITAMVKGHIEQEQFVEALEALENVGAVALSEEQSIEMLLLKCRIFRMMGLVDTATLSLRDRAEYVSDVQLNARISFELAQCHIAEGDLERARSRLSEVLSVAEPGALAQNTALELAGVCLKLGRSPQSISVCLQLLDSDMSPQMKQQTLKTLAAAYTQQKDYDKAASALSGQWK
jgi:tetratricopeptide (TPR) repeat protein